MITEETLIKFRLTRDSNNVKFKEFFKDGSKLKEVHIDTYFENPLTTNSLPFMLLLRLIEKRIIVSNNGHRLILKKNIDKYDTYFTSILFSEITECYYNKNKVYTEFIFKVQNIYYRVTVLN